MTHEATQRALRARFATLTPQWSTHELAMDFKPDPATPYQRATLMLADPETVGYGRGAYTRQQGIFQLDFFYPKKERRTDYLIQRSDAASALFFPTNGRGLTLAAGAWSIQILRKPKISEPIASEPGHNSQSVDVFLTIEIPPG